MKVETIFTEPCTQIICYPDNLNTGSTLNINQWFSKDTATSWLQVNNIQVISVKMASVFNMLYFSKMLNPRIFSIKHPL